MTVGYCVSFGSERGGYSHISRFEPLSDRNPDLAKPAKSFEVLLLQEDLRQHFLHLLQEGPKTTELHKKHLSHILMSEIFEHNNLLAWDLDLSFVNAQAQ